MAVAHYLRNDASEIEGQFLHIGSSVDDICIDLTQREEKGKITLLNEPQVYNQGLKVFFGEARSHALPQLEMYCQMIRSQALRRIIQNQVFSEPIGYISIPRKKEKNN